MRNSIQFAYTLKARILTNIDLMAVTMCFHEILILCTQQIDLFKHFTYTCHIKEEADPKGDFNGLIKFSYFSFEATLECLLCTVHKIGVTRFNFELYVLKERPLRVPKNACSARCYYTLAIKNSKSTRSTIQIPCILIKLYVFE